MVLLDIFRNNKVFIIPYFSFLLIGLPVIIIYPKSDIHLFINGFNSEAADYFFEYITYLGSGLVPIIVAAIFLTVSIRKAFFIAGASCLAGILAQVLKLFVFPDVARPLGYFKGIIELHLVEGVDMHYSHSFPSGHSATIFALCLSLAMLSKSQLVKSALLVLAIIVGYSRIYLSQHFLNDVFAGSVIGIISVPIMKNVFDRIKTDWADKSLVAIIKSPADKDE